MEILEVPSPDFILKNRLKLDKEKSLALVRRFIIELEDRFLSNNMRIECKVYQKLNDAIRDYLLCAFEPRWLECFFSGVYSCL
jgi:hypothetical protein